MNQSTRQWLEHLATVKNNSKAQEIVDHIEQLEEMLRTYVIECGLRGGEDDQLLSPEEQHCDIVADAMRSLGINSHE
ncbi:hypothetical protein [Endozoicomonas sp. SCSIO W0465]|uniref:hypothetical protein n=1 Tax=Endozoicomonas sp. SCSIO W0465 TaxID=2918516 RepID=UPI002076054D|nr:hypothetical protein [Endozoicomonas sp. SCSIO W0465]USE34608.1 hypothetical protein MJO57_21035 [Endozoicomonas sp. SCSIO W0465]